MIVVTSCTARKRVATNVLTLDESFVGQSLIATAARWRSALARQSKRTPVRSLYAGRSFSEARAAAASADAELFVVSAGVGLAAADDQVPAYDLTAGVGEGGLRAALALHSAEPADWWSALCGERGLAQLINDKPQSLFLIALPSSYLRMVAADLSRLSEDHFKHVRLFTSLRGRADLPSAARQSAMPYDERLESVSGYAGTRADFPQRALRHFVERLAGHRLTVAKGRQAVEKSLSKCKLRQVAQRKRIDDEQVRQLVRTNWDACDGKSARLLRFLRDVAEVACEQSRFAQLWREVRDEQER